MEFLVLLFFCGLSAATIGKIKGASFFLWFAVGFFLPLIGTIAAVASRNERLEPLRTCPRCGADVKLYDQVCMQCGEDLEWPEEYA